MQQQQQQQHISPGLRRLRADPPGAEGRPLRRVAPDQRRARRGQGQPQPRPRLRRLQLGVRPAHRARRHGHRHLRPLQRRRLTRALHGLLHAQPGRDDLLPGEDGQGGVLQQAMTDIIIILINVPFLYINQLLLFTKCQS